MPADGSGSGLGSAAAAWARRWWRALAAEALATALLVLLGVATLAAGGGEPPLTHPALAFGFVVLLNVEAFGPASGAHMNPAVTLAAALRGRLPPAAAAAYALAQCAGAAAGFAALAALAPAARVPGAGCTQPAHGPAAAAVTEAVLTGSLVLLVCAHWTAAARDSARPDNAISIKFALAIAGLVYAGGPLTGASLNPARSFGPSVVHGFWKHHWVYWVGPLGGSLVATLTHHYLLTPPPTPQSLGEGATPPPRPRRATPPPDEDPAAVPLNDHKV